MPGPPEDVPPGELFLKLQTPAPSEVVAFPRKTPDGKPIGTVRIMVLPMDSHFRARGAALQKIRKQGLGVEETEHGVGAALLSDAVAQELLWEACCTEENHGNDQHPFYAKIFPSPEEIGKRISAQELGVLFNCYQLVQAKYGPMQGTIESDEQLSQWVKRLAEGAAAFPLRGLSLAHLAELALLLARRSYTLSACLESLFSSLPPILQSRLTRYSLGTSFFGSHARAQSQDGSESSEELRIFDQPITVEMARDLALRLQEAEEAALAELDALDTEMGWRYFNTTSA